MPAQRRQHLRDADARIGVHPSAACWIGNRRSGAADHANPADDELLRPHRSAPPRATPIMEIDPARAQRQPNTFDRRDEAPAARGPPRKPRFHPRERTRRAARRDQIHRPDHRTRWRRRDRPSFEHTRNQQVDQRKRFIVENFLLDLPRNF